MKNVLTIPFSLIPVELKVATCCLPDGYLTAIFLYSDVVLS